MNAGHKRLATEQAHRRAVGRAIAAMRENLDRTPSLEELAEISWMSPYHFDRVFHRITGLPPRRFLTALRLQAAKRLLLTTDLSISDICMVVGYSSLGSFSLRFGLAVGASPSNFRSLADANAEALLSAVRDLAAWSAPDAEAGAGEGVQGRIHAPAECDQPVFVGLFPSAIPAGAPLACAILTRPGSFRLHPVPDGRHHLFASALSWPETDEHLLMFEHSLRGGLPPGEAVVVEQGKAAVPVDIELTLPEETRPPLLVSVPALLESYRSWLTSRSSPPRGRSAYTGSFQDP